ncbi:MAG: HNH endonuclease [Anaerolineales bacterium]|nr:HNH endonuclease [Anaerolineales bacterium]
MPALSPSDLVQSVIDALDESDASAILVSSTRGHPRRFIVQYGRNMVELWVYIWTLTHGGGAARPLNEYRVQLTGVQPPLSLNPNGHTILIGYEPNTGCFAGFDLRKHQTFSVHSPSIQIPITTLNEALQNGFSFVTKGNDEIAIGIRPDQFLAYCLNVDLLHREGADAKMVGLLTKAASLEPISNEEVAQVPQERRRIVSEVSRLSRNSSFRQKVIIAYDRRCAVTRMQLRLIDAAHILPVGAEDSIDEVANGLCLSPTYHRAFDRSLIYLDESLKMQINPAKEKELTDAGLDGGLSDFKAYLGKRIHLPADRNQWPKTEFIHAANEFRRIG